MENLAIKTVPSPLTTASKINTVFQKSFYTKALTTFFVALLVVQVLNISHTLPILWMIIGSLTSVYFFYYFYKFTNSKKWASYPDDIFRKKLFKKALFIRLIFIVCLYYFFTILYGAPFEAGAADAYFYDGIGRDVSWYLMSGQNIFDKLAPLDLGDRGFPVYLGVVYTLVFWSTLLGRLFNAFFGAWSCIFIYDLAKRNFNEQVARLAGFMMMLLPNLIYYSGLTLKETLMVFIVITYINKSDIILREKNIKIKDVLIITFLAGSLFFFRTVLALSAILALFTSVVIVSNRVSKTGRRAFLGVWIIVGVLAIFSTPVGDDITQLISARENNQESQMQNFSTRKGGNSFAKYGSMGIFLPMILVAPFPTFADTAQNNQMMLSGAMFTRNVYAFFVFVGLIVLYRKRLFRKYALILSFLSIYLLTLASSGFALSERFHLPILPFLVILASFGITQMNSKRKANFMPYLVFIAIVIIGWNWFKMAGRGL